MRELSFDEVEDVCGGGLLGAFQFGLRVGTGVFGIAGYGWEIASEAFQNTEMGRNWWNG